MQLCGSRKTNLNNVLKIMIRNNFINKNNAIRNSVIRHNLQIKNKIIENKIIENKIIENKIICLGQPKTGTKTLKQIFVQLGKKASGDPLCFLRNNSDYTTVNDIPIDTNNFFNNISYLQKNLEMFDFFHDVPYSFNYELIDKQYPDSKYILTIRDEEDWFKSLINYQHIPNMSSCSLLNVIYHHEIIMEEHKNEVIELYRKYNNDVITYFKDVPEKLLIINLCDKTKNNTEIIQKITDFTKLVIPMNFVFPHVNSQKYT
jgi:hypothetical protein